MSQVHSDFVDGYEQLVELLTFDPDKKFRWHTSTSELNRLTGPLHDLESRTEARISGQFKEVFTHRSLWAQFVRKHLGTSPVVADFEREGYTYYLVVTSFDKKAITKLRVELKKKLRATALETVAELKASPFYIPGPAESVTNCDWQESLLALMDLQWSEKGTNSTTVVPEDLRAKVAEVLEATA